MPTPRKVEQVAKIKELVEGSRAVYFVDFSKIDARTITELRRDLKQEGIRLKTAKNRMARRGLTAAGVSADLAEIIRGPTSLVLSPTEEPYLAARTLKDFGVKNKEWKFKGAYVEQTLFKGEQFDLLAGMPTRSEVRQQLAGVLLSPLHQLVTTLEGTYAGLIFGLDELAARRKETAPAETPSAPAEIPTAPAETTAAPVETPVAPVP
jgi:large subunit ribosomal protein L10